MLQRVRRPAVLVEAPDVRLALLEERVPGARKVQTHVARAYAKIGVYSRAGAALHLMEKALLD